MGMTPRFAPGRERPSLRWIAAGLLVALAAAAGGWVVADRIAARAPEDTPSGDRVLTAGPARLRVSVPWTPARRPPAVPGLEDAPAWTPYAGLATTVSVALLPAQHPALLPSALVAQAQGGLPRAETAKVVGLQARAYRGLRANGSVLDVYAIPTTRGVLTLVCTAGSGGPAPAWCLSGLDQITVSGASPLKPAADTAYRMRAPEILRTLDKSRVRGRRTLHGAERANGQERAARALAADYKRAAVALAPLAPRAGPAAKVPHALRRA